MSKVKEGESYLPTVPIWSGQSRYYYVNPTSRPPALVCPDISEHSICLPHPCTVRRIRAHNAEALLLTLADSGGAARAQPADTITREGGAQRATVSECTGRWGSAGHSERVYTRSTVKYGWLVSAEWWKEEDGERKLHVTNHPPPPPPPPGSISTLSLSCTAKGWQVWRMHKSFFITYYVARKTSHP